MSAEENVAVQIDAKIAALNDWRGAMLSRLRALIKQADSDAIEELKWRKPSNPSGVPVWSDHGIVCTGETYKAAVKLTFARGAALDDPSGLFNSSLEGNARRAIDFREGDAIEADAFKALIRAAARISAPDAVPLSTRKRSCGRYATRKSPAQGWTSSKESRKSKRVFSNWKTLSSPDPWDSPDSSRSNHNVCKRSWPPPAARPPASR